MAGKGIVPKDVQAANNAAAGQDLEVEQDLANVSLERSMRGRIIELLRPVAPRLALVVGIEALLVCTTFLRPWFVGNIVDRGFEHTPEGILLNRPLVIQMTLGLGLAWVLRFGLSGVSQYLAGTAAIRILGDLRRRVFAHVQSLSVRYFDRTKAGRIVSRADRDVDSLEPLLIQGPPEALSVVLRCVVAGILLFQISPLLFLGVASVLPFLGLGSYLFHRIASKNWAGVAERRSRFTAHLVESVSGVRVIQQAGREEDNRLRYKDLLTDFTNTLIRGNIRASWFLPSTAVLSTVGMSAVLVLGARQVALGEISLGEVTRALFYVNLFLGPIQDLGDLFDRYAVGTAAAQRIYLLLDTKPEIVDVERPAALPALSGRVEFQDVTFAYDPRRKEPVIKNLSLTIEAGKRVAIVGPTGHGKSTLVQLLTRFYEPQQGRILLDGQDISQLAQNDLRRAVGVVLQDNVLFSGTVLENLRVGSPDESTEEIIDAARLLGVDDLIRRLPQGYDTEVGPLGASLSHGQRQVICLVRAYLTDPAVLVLDEATSAIDIQTERRIQEALRRLCTGRTAIIIAHRLATIRDADSIAVIRHGRVVEQGNHAALLAAGGAYAEIHRAYEQGQRHGVIEEPPRVVGRVA